MVMDITCFLSALITGGSVSLVASAVLILLGGYGGYMRLTRAVNVAYDEMERIEARVEREIKARAALSPPKKDSLVESLISGMSSPIPDQLGSKRAAILKRSRQNAIQS